MCRGPSGLAAHVVADPAAAGYVTALVAHDMRVPLATVLHSAHALTERLPAEGAKAAESAWLREQLRGIVRSAEQMSRLIHHLLEVESMSGHDSDFSTSRPAARHGASVTPTMA